MTHSHPISHPVHLQCNSLFGTLVGCVLWLPIFGLLCGKASADWPEFRGPGQNGVVAKNANLPVEWLAQDQERKNIRWYTPTEGLGWSSPVILDDRIYLTSARNNSGSTDSKDLAGPQSLFLSCYGLADGKLLFDKKIFDQPADASSIHKKNSHASPTVLAHVDPQSKTARLFVHFGHQGTACVSLDGELLWTDREHSYNPVHGNGGSPIVVGDHLILTCDGSKDPYTLALDIRTGKE
ncbi:MAG: hypothetical protein ACKO8U_00520, partial [Pirellula sp.]